MVWNNAVRIRDKMMVVFKEMARDGAKFNEKKLKNVHYNEQLQSHPKSPISLRQHFRPVSVDGR